MAIKTKGNTLRSRIIFSFFGALLPVLLLIVIGIELLLVPVVMSGIREDLSNSTKVIANSVRTGASMAIRNHLKSIAERHLAIARQFFLLVDQGLISKEDAVARLRKILLGQKVGTSGYTYCINSEGIAVVHPNAGVENTDNIRFGFVRRQIKMKEGYIEYDWQNPGEPSLRPKALYMVYFEPLDWIISVSSYREEFSSLLSADDFKDTVLSLSFGESGYAFVFNRRGDIIIHPVFEGMNILEQDELPSGFAREMLINRSGMVEYVWKNPEDPGYRKKIAVYETIPELDWVVGSSAYWKEIMQPVTIGRMIGYGSVVLSLFISVLLSYLLSGRITQPVSDIMDRLDRNALLGSRNPLPVDTGSVEFDRLSREFNVFLSTIEAKSAELRSERTRYHSLFKASPDAIFLMKGLEIIDCNPAARHIFSGNAESIIGLSFPDMSPEHQPDGTNSRQAAERAVNNSVAIPLQTFEWVHRALNGRLFYAEIRLMPFSQEQGELLSVAYVRDISKRKKSDEALKKERDRAQQYLDIAGVMFIAIDTSQHVTMINQKGCDILGYEEQEIVGKNWFDNFIKTENTEDIKGIFNEMISGNINPFEYIEHSVWIKGGEERNIAWHNSIIRNESGHIIGTLSSGEDITERKRIEKHLQQAQKMEAIGTLAGGIAHDFNNILTAITGYTELSLSKVEKGTPIHDNLGKVLKAGKRARDLVLQILTFGRQNDQALVSVRIKPVVKEAVKFIRATLPTSIEIRNNIHSNPTVLADQTQVHQIIMNLCTNAGHAMQDDGGTLEIGLEIVDPGPELKGRFRELRRDGYAKLSVKDTGAGIPPDKIDKIFDPYFTTKEKDKGTGLGLATVHGIVRSHGGAVTVESHPGEGTTFEVYLPLAPDSYEENVDTEDLTTGRGERILLVDDEKDVMEVEKEILEELGYTVLATDKADEALAVFARQPDDFDLVISDMTMPKITGDKLAVELIKIRSDIPILLCTGFSESMSLEKAESMGIKGFLMKPVTVKSLSHEVRKVLKMGHP